VLDWLRLFFDTLSPSLCEVTVMADEVVVHERRRGKRWWQSKVNITNAAIAIIAIIGLLANMPEFAHLAPYMLLATNIINILLRTFVTSEPIGPGR
jgi:hypothetical protein